MDARTPDYVHGKNYVYDATSQTFHEAATVNMFQDIRNFHEKFGLSFNGKPRTFDKDLAKFRVGFMAEELGEYCLDEEMREMAVDFFKENMTPQNVSIEKQFDALIDLVYVALGTAYLQGFDFNEGWRRVHEANMKKVRTLREVDSARGSLYDVIKPVGWAPPSLADLV